MHFKNVLSCFDGVSCGQLALIRAGHTYDNYYASEVDKYAIKIALKNFPNTVQLGDIKSVWSRNLPQIDLIMGGSPCQDLSIAKAGRKGLDGERSCLFWHFVRLVRTCKPKYFLLENVASMPKESKDIISKALGVEPILINSALVSAQQRKRLYWTNIPNITQPQDKGLLLKDILESGLPTEEKAYALTARYSGYSFPHDFEKKKSGVFKVRCLPATYYKENLKSLLKRGKNNLTVNDTRKLSPVECERLQTLPDNYTEGVSNTQRYKCIGNGWTVDVIAHIFSFIRED